MTEKPRVRPVWLTAEHTSSKWLTPTQMETSHITGKANCSSSQMALLWVQPKPKTTREYPWPCNLSRPGKEHHTTTEDPDDGAADCSVNSMESPLKKIWVWLTVAPRAPALCGSQAAGCHQSQHTYFIPFPRLSSNLLSATSPLPAPVFLCTAL